MRNDIVCIDNDCISTKNIRYFICFFLVLSFLWFDIYRNLGNNIFPKLPKNGLKNVLHLKTFNNPKLREFPPPDTFPRIQVEFLCATFYGAAINAFLNALIIVTNVSYLMVKRGDHYWWWDKKCYSLWFSKEINLLLYHFNYTLISSTICSLFSLRMCCCFFLVL